jgi:arylsulfatase A-like enzyme
MKKENVILLTLDAVRPDRLSCYGYNKIETIGIDEIAKEGVLFKTCICSSCLTPVSHASILSGKNPNKTKVRDPFNSVQTVIISEILKGQGYKTAGFVGIDLIDSKHKFNKEFDYFDEPKEEGSFHTMWFKGKEQKLKVRLGNWWIDKMFHWLRKNAADTFFIWGHYFHAHFLAEKSLLYSGKIDPDKLIDHAYYDAKIKYMDEQLLQPLIKILKEFNIWDNTTIIITSDHGETLGTKQPNWKSFYFDYPQHKSMYESDLKVPLIIKNEKLGKKIIDHPVRAIDIVPTLVDLLDITASEKFDGESLVPLLLQGEKVDTLTAYAEDLYKERGPGAIQAVRTPKYKLIRNLTNGEEEFYNLEKDKSEKNNILNTSDPKTKKIIKEFRKIMDRYLEGYTTSITIGEEEKEKIKRVLRDLGYIT